MTGVMPVQEQWKRQVIQSSAVAVGIDRRVEILRQPGERADIARAADQRVTVFMVDIAQRVDQAADICADAEVPDAPGVNGDVKRHVMPD